MPTPDLSVGNPMGLLATGSLFAQCKFEMVPFTRYSRTKGREQISNTFLASYIRINVVVIHKHLRIDEPHSTLVGIKSHQLSANYGSLRNEDISSVPSQLYRVYMSRVEEKGSNKKTERQLYLRLMHEYRPKHYIQ